MYQYKDGPNTGLSSGPTDQTIYSDTIGESSSPMNRPTAGGSAMDRRAFLVSAGAGAAGGALGVRSGRAQTGSSGSAPGPKPNILFILVDELRYPSVFPSGVSSVDQFLATFMPNVYALWQRGVKFGSHYTAATACSPARGVLISGPYSQQSWLLQTIKNGLGLSRASPTPPLNPVFPTYGKL